MRKSRLAGLTAIFIVVFLSLSISIAYAQYATQQTANVTIGSNGSAHIDENSTVGGVSIDIAGAPGAAGSVSTATYNANPQPDASVPSNAALTHFVVVTFNMPAADFYGANIVIHYGASDVSGISPPYVLYKYDSASNSYVQLNAVVDTNAQTITASVTSPTDPLFAIGGTATTTTTSSAGVPASAWAAVAVVVVIVVVLAVVVLMRRKPKFKVLEA